MAQPLALGAVLVEQTSLSESDLDRARARQAEKGLPLPAALLDLGALDETELLRALGDLYGLPVRESLTPDEIDLELASRVPISFAKTHHLIPLRMEGEQLQVAIADPLATGPLDSLRLLFPEARVEAQLASRGTILSCINRVYDRAASASDVAGEFSDEDLQELAEEVAHEPEDLLDATEQSGPIIKLVNSLLQQAVKARASDIHVEPHERELIVRFRTDDMLYEPITPLPRRMQQAITSRMKIMSGLNIAEKRLPQDGRIVLKIAGNDYDVRVSTIPTQYGERVVLRLLPRTQNLLDLQAVGLDPTQQATIRRLMRRTTGILLVTGPTGSGKTTTLYAGLSDINSREKNIITIEDPVEIHLDGIGQIEVRPQIGLTFAAGLRSILRQDPNVILVGEIRDLETAEIAIQASLTGHLVLSTIHTNDAAGAITRLIDFGVEPFLIGSSLAASMAQRLVRRLCTVCREPHAPTPEELREIRVVPEQVDGHQIYRAVGCDECGGTGYRGRVGIFEVLEVNDRIRKLIGTGVDSNTIHDTAVSNGMVSLRQDGTRKVLQGLTTIAEILRQTEEEAIISPEPGGR